LPGQKGITEKVLADDLEVADVGPVLEEVAIVRDPKAQPERVSG
jgi:hypothetical protein